MVMKYVISGKNLLLKQECVNAQAPETPASSMFIAQSEIRQSSQE